MLSIEQRSALVSRLKTLNQLIDRWDEGDGIWSVEIFSSYGIFQGVLNEGFTGLQGPLRGEEIKNYIKDDWGPDPRLNSDADYDEFFCIPRDEEGEHWVFFNGMGYTIQDCREDALISVMDCCKAFSSHVSWEEVPDEKIVEIAAWALKKPG